MYSPEPRQTGQPSRAHSYRSPFPILHVLHTKITHLSAEQKERALHECLDWLDTVKQHIYNPGTSPQTLILALATILERAHYTAYGRDRVITGQVPI